MLEGLSGVHGVHLLPVLSLVEHMIIGVNLRKPPFVTQLKNGTNLKDGDHLTSFPVEKNSILHIPLLTKY
jgi:hypothetical protein